MLAAAYVVGLRPAAGQAAPAAAPAPAEARTMPTLFLAGDSTMAGGGGGTQGWGNALAPFFDTSRIKVENHAIAGRSSRGYMDDPRGWATIQPKLQKGDFVFIQFGHNDDEASALNVLRFRFTLSGVGDEAAEFEVPSTTQGAGESERRARDENYDSYLWLLHQEDGDRRAGRGSDADYRVVDSAERVEQWNNHSGGRAAWAVGKGGGGGAGRCRLWT